MEDKFLEIITQNQGKIIGVVVGLFLAILIIGFGFWKTLLIILCILAGYFIGKRIDDHKSFSSLINKFLGEKQH